MQAVVLPYDEPTNAQMINSSLVHHTTVRSESRCVVIKEVMSTSIYTGLNPFNFICMHFLQICRPLYVVLQAQYLSLAPACAVILMDSTA
jgi:hypothetical protein